MIEEMKERLLEHKTVAAVLGTVLVMLVVFFAWSSVTRPQAQLQSDLPTISSSIPASSSLETTKQRLWHLILKMTLARFCRYQGCC